MSGWIDGYLQASFRGVEFYVQSSGHSGGRRLVTHVFPERDDAEYEDLGRKNPEFQVTGYLVGDDYYKQRNDLISALEEQGTGTLVHPYRGDLEVYAGAYSIREEETEGRICRFDVTFYWKTDKRLTVSGPSAAEDLYEKKKSFLEKAVAFFEKTYDAIVSSKPFAAMDDAIAVGNQCLDVIQAAKKVTGTIGEFQAKIDTLKGQIRGATLLLGAIGEDFTSLIDFGTDTKETSYSVASGDFATEQFNELRSITQIQNTTLSNYPSSATDGFPSFELQKHLARSAMASQAGLLADMTINNSSEADAYFKEINDLIDTVEADETIDDDYFQVVRDLRVAANKVIAERKLTLDRLTVTRLDDVEPAIVTSYRLYENVERDEEIADLNEILHPGFIPPIVNVTVQVS